MRYVFDFDHVHDGPPMERKDLLGGKGAKAWRRRFAPPSIASNG